ncbi:MAG: hypothetical protein OEY78_12775 [Gammaproteobacteria bacterium]|nr:hypothetical protein [Gammaproteobacteria bacterium]
MTKSRTIWFNYIMLITEFLWGSVAMFQTILSDKAYVIVFLLLGMIHTAGGHYWRTKTTQPLSERKMVKK